MAPPADLGHGRSPAAAAPSASSLSPLLSAHVATVYISLECA